MELAYQGLADPADTIFERGFYDPELDWHWSPPAETAFRFDMDRARQALADAGYTDTDGNGILNDPKNGGKDIKLRLWARRESPQSQAMGKLITGWWEELGLDIDYSVEDNGVLIDGGEDASSGDRGRYDVHGNQEGHCEGGQTRGNCELLGDADVTRPRGNGDTDPDRPGSYQRGEGDLGQDR